MSTIAEKIQALLNLANSNANAAEGQAAMTKALELMAKYNVSEQAITDVGKDAIIEICYPIKSQMIFKGCMNIVAIMTREFKVFAYTTKKELRVVGHESKLRGCIAMIDYLLHNAKYNMPRGYSHTEKQGYYLGYSKSVSELLARSATGATPGLTTSLKEYKDFVGGHFNSSRKSKVKVDVGARDAGRDAGSKVNLNKQLGTRMITAG
jgi:hypothetical protein